MKTRLWILVASVMMIFASASVWAQSSDRTEYAFRGSNLIKGMRQDDNTAYANARPRYLGGLYEGYVLGVRDGMQVFVSYNFPRGITNGQFVAVVSKYLKAHPERWNEDAALLVINALQEAFPKK